MTPLDLVIVDARVIDGTAHAVPTATDVGIADGRIAEIGGVSGRSRRATVEARGRVVAPGFVDSHTHVEMASLRRHGDRFAPVAQGVTTTFVGADGFGWVGLRDSDRRRWWDDSSAIYGPPPDPLPDWRTPDRFLSDLRAASPTSVVPLVPHGNVRAAVMGDAQGSPSVAEIGRMQQFVREWMDAGAVGLATGLDYLPGRYASSDELVKLCEPVAERGGVYASHLRLHDLGRAHAWREIGEIGRRTGIPIRIAHERIDEEADTLLAEISPGNDVTFDTYLYSAGCTSLTFHVPAELLAHGVMALRENLARDRALRDRLIAHMEDRLTGKLGQEAIIAATTSGRFEGQTLTELSSARGSSVGQVAVDLLLEELPCALLVYVWHAADATWDETVARTLADDRSIIATDGVYLGSSPHPRGFGTFPRVLGELARDRGLISLPAAIHKMTGKPAAAYGLSDRGRLEPGLRADLVMFDPAVVSGPADFEHPRTSPEGIDLVLVAGRRVDT